LRPPNGFQKNVRKRVTVNGKHYRDHAAPLHFCGYAASALVVAAVLLVRRDT
jgi:hypothetical protein